MPVEVHTPSSRDGWLELRRPNIGASAVGALLGVHEYITAYQLWCLKTGRIDEDPQETPPMRRGRLLEPVALALLAEERPHWKIEPNPMPGGRYFVDPQARLAATPDAFVDCESRGIVQVKSVEASIFRQKWRDEHEGVTPPLWIAVQATVEAHLTGAEWACVAALVVGHGIDLHVVEIPLKPALVDRIRAEVGAFWSMVENDTPPAPDYGRDGAVLARMFADDNGQEIELSADNILPELLEERAEIKARGKADDARLKEIETEIVAKLGPYERAHVPGWRILRPTVHRKAYQVAANSYRRLTIKQTA